jgi:hypothetical protein
VLEGMARLGLARAGLDLLSSRCLRSDEDELRYISLDLSRGPGARVKIYFAHHDATAAHLERVFSLSPSHRQGDVSEFCAQMVGRRRQFAAKPLTSCFSFVAGQDVPSAVTLHVPVAHYVRDDATVGQRFGAYLERQGVSAQPYSTALAALAKGPLDASSGLQSYASFRREPSGLRATAYLSPMVFSGTSAQSEVRRSFR